MAQAPSAAPAPPQHMVAWEKAVWTRVSRAEFKADVRSGQRTLTEALLDPPSYLMRAKVYDLLRMVHNVGHVKARAYLTRCEIEESTEVQKLTPRQRSALAEKLHGR